MKPLIPAGTRDEPATGFGYAGCKFSAHFVIVAKTIDTLELIHEQLDMPKPFNRRKCHRAAFYRVAKK